jgi:Asp/Glu/hydantoin racemase
MCGAMRRLASRIASRLGPAEDGVLAALTIYRGL